jgi:hypothetical protein
MSAGILLVVLPSVMYGGLSILMLLTAGAPGIADNPLCDMTCGAPGTRTQASISSCRSSCFST